MNWKKRFTIRELRNKLEKINTKHSPDWARDNYRFRNFLERKFIGNRFALFISRNFLKYLKKNNTTNTLYKIDFFKL